VTALPARAPARDVRVLVVDDEPMVLEVVSRYLERDGYLVDAAADGAKALEMFERRPPHLVILDLMLPCVPGLDVLRELRRRSDVPVVLLTARGIEADRVSGLELGADDYVVKPFSPRELVARVRSILRRVDRTDAPGLPMEWDGLVIDPASREVFVDGRHVTLTRREFDLLLYMARHPRRVCTRAQLLEHVWDSSAEWQDSATVTVHVGHLRQKIERDPQRPRWIATVRGVGYRFEP
jgi:DNA-binding response OmpR family regulator